MYESVPSEFIGPWNEVLPLRWAARGHARAAREKRRVCEGEEKLVFSLFPIVDTVNSENNEIIPC